MSVSLKEHSVHLDQTEISKRQSAWERETQSAEWLEINLVNPVNLSLLWQHIVATDPKMFSQFSFSYF